MPISRKTIGSGMVLTVATALLGMIGANGDPQAPTGIDLTGILRKPTTRILEQSQTNRVIVYEGDQGGVFALLAYRPGPDAERWISNEPMRIKGCSIVTDATLVAPQSGWVAVLDRSSSAVVVFCTSTEVSRVWKVDDIGLAYNISSLGPQDFGPEVKGLFKSFQGYALVLSNADEHLMAAAPELVWSKTLFDFDADFEEDILALVAEAKPGDK